MPIRHIAFDLDGTLLDTRDQIVASLLACLPSMQRTEKTKADLYTQVKTSPKSILRQFGIVSLQEYWRHHANLAHRSRLFFADTALTMQELRSKGLSLSVITSLPAHPAIALLNQTRLREHFSLIDTFASRNYRKPSPNLLLAHLHDLGVSPAEAIYVGDTDRDMHMAKGAGATAWGAGWGTAVVAELTQAGADRILKSMHEIVQLIP